MLFKFQYLVTNDKTVKLNVCDFGFLAFRCWDLCLIGKGHFMLFLKIEISNKFRTIPKMLFFLHFDYFHVVIRELQ